MVLLVALCLLMLLIILMQRPKQEGLGAAFGGGVMDGMLGSGTTNFLQKGTVYLTVGYFVLTMTLAVIQARTSEARSLQGKNLEATASASATTEDDEETAPADATPLPIGTDPVDTPVDPTPLVDEIDAPTEDDAPADDSATTEPTEETDADDTKTTDEAGAEVTEPEEAPTPN